MSNPEEDPRPLTRDELAVLVRYIGDSEYRARLNRVFNETILNPDAWRRIGELLSESFLSRDRWAEAAEALRAAYLDPDVWRRAGALVSETYLNPDVWREAADRAAEPLSASQFREIGPSVRDAISTAANDTWPTIQTDVEAFEREIALNASDPVETDEAPLWWWLRTREDRQQAQLLVAALAILQKCSVLAFGDVLPDPLKDATDAVFAVAAFLLIWLEISSHDR